MLYLPLFSAPNLPAARQFRPLIRFHPRFESNLLFEREFRALKSAVRWRRRPRMRGPGVNRITPEYIRRVKLSTYLQRRACNQSAKTTLDFIYYLYQGSPCVSKVLLHDDD